MPLLTPCSCILLSLFSLSPSLRFNKINDFPLEMAVLFAHPNEGKLRMAVAGNPLLRVEAAAGMWTGGVWRPMDVHMPDAQVVQYILEQATMRVIGEKVWKEEGPFDRPRDFSQVCRPVRLWCTVCQGRTVLHARASRRLWGRGSDRVMMHQVCGTSRLTFCVCIASTVLLCRVRAMMLYKAMRKYFGGSWHDGLEGIAHGIHSYYRVREDVSLPAPSLDRVNDAERAEVSWYHTNVTMMHRKAEVVRKQRRRDDAREEEEAEQRTQAKLDRAAQQNGGVLSEQDRAVILQVRACSWHCGCCGLDVHKCVLICCVHPYCCYCCGYGCCCGGPGSWCAGAVQQAAAEKKVRERRRRVARRDVDPLRRALPAGEWKELWRKDKMPPQGRDWTSLWDVDSSSSGEDDEVPASSDVAQAATPAGSPTDHTRPVKSLTNSRGARPADLEDMYWQLPVPTKVKALKERLGPDRQLSAPALLQGSAFQPDGSVSVGAGAGAGAGVGAGAGPHSNTLAHDSADDSDSDDAAVVHDPDRQKYFHTRDEEGRNKFRGKWGWSRYRHLSRPPQAHWDKNSWSKKGQERCGRSGVLS